MQLISIFNYKSFKLDIGSVADSVSTFDAAISVISVFNSSIDVANSTLLSS